MIHVPDHWTAEQALLVCAFLEDVARAIWDRHGERMARLLYDLDKPQTEPSADAPEPLRADAPVVDDELDHEALFSDSDIPF